MLTVAVQVWNCLRCHTLLHPLYKVLQCVMLLLPTLPTDKRHNSHVKVFVWYICGHCRHLNKQCMLSFCKGSPCKWWQMILWRFVILYFPILPYNLSSQQTKFCKDKHWKKTFFFKTRTSSKPSHWYSAYFGWSFGNVSEYLLWDSFLKLGPATEGFDFFCSKQRTYCIRNAHEKPGAF